MLERSNERERHCTVYWCGRRDLNPHDLRHWNLNPARLPIPPRPLRSFGVTLIARIANTASTLAITFDGTEGAPLQASSARGAAPKT
jgi:hypothetical protein